MTNPVDIAERVEATIAREDRNVAWLARATGIPDKTLRRRFIDPSGFKIAELSAIARVLHTDVEEFFTSPKAAA